MSIKPHVMTADRLDPFEGLSFIPEELQTVKVTVINADPNLNPNDEVDFFGIEQLLGALAGVRPFGEQTQARVAARKEFHGLMARGQQNTALLRNLGRVGFIDVVHGANESVRLADRIVLAEPIDSTADAEPKGSILVIAQETIAWQALAAELTTTLGSVPYLATFKRRNPPTEKGLSWRITGGQI